jgi:methyl-accepting chemotaxis protein
MNPSEIFDFLLPQLSDPLQCGFFFVIILMITFTIALALFNARPAEWQRKWDRGTPNDHSDDLDIEHGSVTDLCHAVATGSEKLAEIMPGILLIIGLLGTFLGLGLALNHASHILGQPNALSASGAANSMQDLLGLLQGLGTKFKTSTWGIIGFLLLKIWSEISRLEEKRLTWVISKVKTELESRKKQQATYDLAKQGALFEQIRGAALSIAKEFTEQFALLMKNEKLLHQQTLLNNRQGIEEICTALGNANIEIRAMSETMANFSQNTQEVIKSMDDAAERMAGGADKVGVAANSLVSAVDAFKGQFTDVLEDVRKDLSAAIGEMSARASETLERGSSELGNATRGISTALGALSTDVKDTMSDVKNSINKALEIQQKAANEFTKSSNEFTLSNQALNDHITATTEIVGKLATPIQEGLQSVADSGRRMHGIGKILENSIQSMGKVAEQLIELPTALAPLKIIPNAQLDLISKLGALGVLPEQQQAILLELQGLRRDQKLASTEVETRSAELATGHRTT